MRVHIFCGKGGVGKTNSAVSLALLLSCDYKTAIVDYDGGHSVKNTLGLKGNFSTNIVHEISSNLHVAVIENSDYIGIAQSQIQKFSLEDYLKQFPADFGIIPLSDMVNAFFGVPTDIPNLQKFVTLVNVLTQLEQSGFTDVVVDVEPTAGLERLLSNAGSTSRSIRNLKNSGKISLAILGVKWPDIAAYLKGEYVKNADNYCDRIEHAVEVIKGAMYLLVCTPEAGPVTQTFEVRRIIEKFGGKVRGYVVNNVRCEQFEEENIRMLPQDLPIVRIGRRSELHDMTPDKTPVLLEIGVVIAKSF